MTEEWRAISGYEGYYEVSDQGRVRSLDRTIMHGPFAQRRRGVILSPGPLSHGHLAVVLNRGSGDRRTIQVHQLVASAFVPGQAPGLEVCHLYDDKNDNSAKNLRWGTRSENMADRRKNGIDPNLNKTHCPAGHRYDEGNTYVNPKSNSRTCRTCQRARAKGYRARAEATA